MKRANLKESNISEIIDFGNKKNNSIQGNKLRALYSLIQKKGEPIESNDSKLNGVKAMFLNDSTLIAMLHYPTGKTFFPCMTKTYLLEL